MSGIPKNFDSSQTISGKQTDIELFEFNEIKLERKILLSDGQTVFFNNNQFKKLVDFELACNRLSQNKLGILASAKKMKVHYLIKKLVALLSMTLINMKRKNISKLVKLYLNIKLILFNIKVHF